MISISATFIIIVLSLYVYCATILYPGEEPATLLWIYTAWILLHSTVTLMIIHHSSLLTREVILQSIFIRHYNIWYRFFSYLCIKHFYFGDLQGRRTFRIVDEIINCCNDSELMQSVLIFEISLKKQTLFLHFHFIKPSIGIPQLLADCLELIGLYYFMYDLQ